MTLTYGELALEAATVVAEEFGQAVVSFAKIDGHVIAVPGRHLLLAMEALHKQDTVRPTQKTLDTMREIRKAPMDRINVEVGDASPIHISKYNQEAAYEYMEAVKKHTSKLSVSTQLAIDLENSIRYLHLVKGYPQSFNLSIYQDSIWFHAESKLVVVAHIDTEYDLIDHFEHFNDEGKMVSNLSTIDPYLVTCEIAERAGLLFPLQNALPAYANVSNYRAY